MSETEKPRKELVCVMCGRKYEGWPNQKYCSSACRSKAHRIKDRARNGGSTVSKADISYSAGCKGCWYRGDVGTCDYLDRAGQCRPCVPYKGGGCDAHTPKQAEPVRTWDEQKARELWAETGERYNELPRKRMDELTRAVAEKLGCAPNSIKAWLHQGGARDVV